jgi:hypothetical protein
MLGTHEGHNDTLLQPACRFSVLATMFVLGKEKGELARVAQEVQGHVIRRALVKIPSDLVCIIESIRGMSVDISRRKASRRWRRLMCASDFAAAAGLFIPPPHVV